MTQSPWASHLWLSAIEDLPPRAVVVFTTNAPERFQDRFLDRCERVEFEADGALLSQEAQALVDRIWRDETGRRDAPRVGSLNVMDKHGAISFRRCVAALEPMVRDAAKRRASMPAPPVVSPAPAVPVAAPVPPAAPTSASALARPVATHHDAPAAGPKLAVGTAATKPRRPTRPDAPDPALAELRRRPAVVDREVEAIGRRLLVLDDQREELMRKIKAARKPAK